MGGSKPIAATLCDGETATNYIQPGPAALPYTRSLLVKEGDATTPGSTLDSAITSGGSNAG